QHDDHLSLRRRWPIRACGRESAKDGLQKRPLHGRRIQSLESHRFTDNKVTSKQLVFVPGTFLTWPRSAVSNKRHISKFVGVMGLLLVAFFLSGSTTNPADVYLPQLKNSDPDTRIAALRELLTSLDSRIPEAMLPLLSDEGNSIRRLAARAIGSRWWQIPKEKAEGYINALQHNLRSEVDFEDEKNMAERGIGLLTRRYDSKMFSRSPNARWVIYERRGFPCLIDTTT